MPKKLTLTAAFATYDAELVNARWVFSSIARDGSLVISCWNHYLKKFRDGHQRYEDCLSRWTANTPGTLTGIFKGSDNHSDEQDSSQLQVADVQVIVSQSIFIRYDAQWRQPYERGRSSCRTLDASTNVCQDALLEAKVS